VCKPPELIAIHARLENNLAPLMPPIQTRVNRAQEIPLELQRATHRMIATVFLDFRQLGRASV